jgi:hypothetical protein
MRRCYLDGSSMNCGYDKHPNTAKRNLQRERDRERGEGEDLDLLLWLALAAVVGERAAHVPVVEEERGCRTHRRWLTRGGTWG